MHVRSQLVMLLAGLVASVALAQPPDSPQAAAPAPRDTKLLDEVPDYATILQRQWSEGLPGDVRDAEESIDQYGRLIDSKPQRATSLAQCIVLAVENNTDAKIQRLGPMNATAQVRRAQSAFDPAVYADLDKDRLQVPAVSVLTASGSPTTFTSNVNANIGVRKMLRTGGLLTMDFRNNRFTANPSLVYQIVPRYTTTVGLSLNQPLLRDFGWNYAMLIVEIAQNTEQQAYYVYKANLAAIVARVEQAYWRLVLAQQNIHVQEQALALSNELLRQNEGKFNVGSLPRTAVLEAQAEVARREAILIQSRNLADVASDNLRALINAPQPDTTALLMIEPQDQPSVVPYDIDFDRSLKSALDQRPELLAARLDVHGRGLARKAAENQLLPKVNFVGGIGLNGLSGSDGHVLGFASPPATPAPLPPPDPSLIGGYGRALDFLPDSRFYNYAFGATVEIPIDNARAKADFASANIGFEQSRLSLQRTQELVTLEIKNAVSNLQTDIKSIDARRLARELAEENVRNQQARYDVGLATTKDLLDFQDKLTQARFAEVEALTSYNINLAEMRRADGTLLPARNVLIERLTPEATPWWATF